ncbi:MAG: hypothetical protein Q7R93_01165 [bacterium]|nr:hypothetical protein [bacterium]
MISEELKRLCEGLGPSVEETQEQGPYISVEQLTGRFGAMYEKLRSLVDYKDYHVIRRSAIKRIVKRRLYLERAANIGIALLRELVSSGYLPNNKVPEAKAAVIESITRKWAFLKREGLPVSLSLDFTAIEIESFLYPDTLTDHVTRSFFRATRTSVVYQGFKQTDNLLVTYAACRRSLLGEDQTALLYALVAQAVPEITPSSQTDGVLTLLAPQVLRALKRAEAIAADPLVWKVSSRLKNTALFHAILLEILRSHGKGAPIVFEDEQQLKELARSIIEKKQRQQRRLTRVSGERAVIYLLLTKIILGMALEWPYEHFIIGVENYVALGTNALFHPILLYLMVTFIQGDKKSIERVVEGVSDLVRGKEVKQIFIRPPVNPVTFFFVVCFYVFLFAATFGAILSGLITLLHFNVVSIILFFVFLTLVSYFGLRIRGTARRWEPAIEKPGTLGLVWNLFAFPIVQTGRWVSVRFAAVNVFVLFLDFLVEVPFKAFLGILDASLAFIKEHRVETY